MDATRSQVTHVTRSALIRMGQVGLTVVLCSNRREYIVRRLMPVECERLQGFPDGWTDVEYKGKPAKDTPRYKSIGNSMAVPEMLWIGKRIEEVDAA